MIIIIPEGVSPGTRGCTNAMHSDCPKVNGLPRHTGLHREATTGSPLPRRSPPAHGAAPGTVSISEAIKTVSPGTRGCTQSIAVDGLMAWSPPTHGAAPVYPTAHWCGATVSPGTRGCTAHDCHQSCSGLGSHVVLDDGVLAVEPVLVLEPLEDAFGRVALLSGDLVIVFKDVVDDAGEWFQLGAPGRSLPPVTRRDRVGQHLRYSVPVQPEHREASRMLMPSTITALRTRRYDSTWYIPGTIHGSRMTLWMAEDGTIFNRHLSAIYPPTWSNLTPSITMAPSLRCAWEGCRSVLDSIRYRCPHPYG